MKYEAYILLLAICFHLLMRCIASSECDDEMPSSVPFLIQWTNITVITSDNSRKILNFGPGIIKSGRLLAVMGPSGSGKSTFINTIIGLNTANVITYNDIITDLRKSDIAFVPQDYSHFEMMTVQETLELAENFHRIMHESADHNNNSNSSSSSHENTSKVFDDKYMNNQVQEIMRRLSLSKVKDSYVGNPYLVRGVSGGERKRLSIASELIGHDKRVIICDEPNSGLDSYQAQQVIAILKKLTERGITVICVIHQPRSSIWSMMDDILLIANGEIAYFGERNKLVNYFKNIGFFVPFETNPADYVLDLVSVDYSSPESSRKSIETILLIRDAYERSKDTKQIECSTENRLKHRMIISQQQNLVSQGNNVYAFVRASVKKFSRSVRRFTLLLKRAAKQALRDNATNVVRVGISALLALIVASVNGGRQSDNVDASNISDRINIIAQAVINVGMLSMIKTLQLFKREKAVIDRERSQDQYTALEYLLAKLAAELPLDALVAAIFSIVLYDRTHLKAGLFNLINVLSLLSCASSTLGLAVGSLLPMGDVSLAAGPALMVIYVVVGTISPSSSNGNTNAKPLPSVLKLLRFASPFKWACEALTIQELTSNSNIGFSVTEMYHRPVWKKIINIVTQTLISIGGKIVHITRGTNSPTQALKALGLNEGSSSNSTFKLRSMVFVHSLLALIGLLINRK